MFKSLGSLRRGGGGDPKSESRKPPVAKRPSRSHTARRKQMLVQFLKVPTKSDIQQFLQIPCVSHVFTVC